MFVTEPVPLNGKRALVEGARVRVSLLLLVQIRQVAEAHGDRGVCSAVSRFGDGRRPFEQRQRGVELLPVLQDVGEVGETADDARMGFADGVLVYRQRAPQQRLRLGVFAHPLVQEGQVVEALGNERMVGTGQRFGPRQQLARDRNGFPEFARGVEGAGSFREAFERGCGRVVFAEDERVWTESAEKDRGEEGRGEVDDKGGEPGHAREECRITLR